MPLCPQCTLSHLRQPIPAVTLLLQSHAAIIDAFSIVLLNYARSSNKDVIWMRAYVDLTSAYAFKAAIYTGTNAPPPPIPSEMQPFNPNAKNKPDDPPPLQSCGVHVFLKEFGILVRGTTEQFFIFLTIEL